MGISSVESSSWTLGEFYMDKSNSLFLPSIQREFVWDSDQIKNLIESIVHNYPIGSVILWKTKDKIPSSKLYENSKEKSHADRVYLIDGQQRLTSLLLVKNNWEIRRDGKPISVDHISFSPEKMLFETGSRKGIDLSLILNSTLGDPDSLLKIQKDYPSQFTNSIRDVGSKIVNYKIPYYTITTDDKSDGDVYEQIAEIFTRVNSAGTQIGNLEMFLSFFAGTFPRGGKEKIMNFHDKLSRDYHMDLEPMIRFIFSELGLSQHQITRVKSFKSALQSLKNDYEKNQKELNKVIENCFSCTKAVWNFLTEEFGFSSVKFLPSQNMTVPLFDFCYRNDLKSVSAIRRSGSKDMVKWFIIGSFYGLYSGSPTTKMAKDLEVISSAKRNFPGKQLMQLMNKSLNISAIRKSDIVPDEEAKAGKRDLMLLFSLMHYKGATNWAGKSINFENVTVHHIFPQDFLKENGVEQPEKIGSLGNLTFVGKEVNSSIGNKAPSEYLKDYSKKILGPHFINPDESLWTIDRFDEFLKARRELIWRGVKEFIN